MKALIVEDKVQLADAVKEYLRIHKVDATVCNDGMEGYCEATRGVYDVIVLDLMLPGKDGLSIIKDLRKEKLDTPIIVLTAKATTEDKVECLLAGADDYLTKPFVLEELLARLFVLTRRKGNVLINEMTFADVKLDSLNHTLCKGDAAVALSMKEYQIMELLMTNTTKIVEKGFILDKVWGCDSDTYYNSAEVYISFLRKKLEGIKASCRIKSIRNVGYKLVLLSDNE